MPYTITMLALIGLVLFVVYIFRKWNRTDSRKVSWLYHLDVGDKARVVIPNDKIIFGKVTKIEKDSQYFTVEYRVKKEFISPPFNL